MDIRFFPGGVAGCSRPNLSAAALVNRGAITGGAVDATLIVSDRLCPGTPVNVFLALSFSHSFSAASFSLSLRGGGIRPVLAIDMRDLRGSPLGVPSTERPCRRSAALVRRGAMSGAWCVFGNGRARNTGSLDDELDLVEPRLSRAFANPGARASEELGEGVCISGGVTGAERPSCRASRMAELTERREAQSYSPANVSLSTWGSSDGGKGGLEAKSEAINISAWASLLTPITASLREGRRVKRTWTARRRSRT